MERGDAESRADSAFADASCSPVWTSSGHLGSSCKTQEGRRQIKLRRLFCRFMLLLLTATWFAGIYFTLPIFWVTNRCRSKRTFFILFFCLFLKQQCYLFKESASRGGNTHFSRCSLVSLWNVMVLDRFFLRKQTANVSSFVASVSGSMCCRVHLKRKEKKKSSSAVFLLLFSQNEQKSRCVSSFFFHYLHT